MQYLAVFESGNYAVNLYRKLKDMGIDFLNIEITPIPCKISTGGCSYCMKFTKEYKDIIINEGKNQGTEVKEIYKITKDLSRNKYEKIWDNFKDSAKSHG